MNEREFYRVILGLETPWEVQAVKVDTEGQKVEVRVGYRAGILWVCPESRERLPVPPGPELAEGHDHGSPTRQPPYSPPPPRWSAVGGTWSPASSRRC